MPHAQTVQPGASRHASESRRSRRPHLQRSNTITHPHLRPPRPESRQAPPAYPLRVNERRLAQALPPRPSLSTPTSLPGALAQMRAMRRGTHEARTRPLGQKQVGHNVGRRRILPRPGPGRLLDAYGLLERPADRPVVAVGPSARQTGGASRRTRRSGRSGAAPSRGCTRRAPRCPRQPRAGPRPHAPGRSVGTS